MKKTVSVYEAKAHLSKILRAVREHGETFTVTYHGEPVAEIRPVGDGEESFEARLRRLEATGVVVSGGDRRGELEPIAPRSGALERFLGERD